MEAEVERRKARLGFRAAPPNEDVRDARAERRVKLARESLARFAGGDRRKRHSIKLQAVGDAEVQELIEYQRINRFPVDIDRMNTFTSAAQRHFVRYSEYSDYHGDSRDGLYVHGKKEPLFELLVRKAGPPPPSYAERVSAGLRRAFLG